MAGDWIKIEHAMPDKPEVVRIAGELGIDQDAVTGKLLRLWIWADQQTETGNALSVTEAFVDRHTFCPGLAEALRNVGWLEGRNGHLSIPNFSRHNGQTAKKRANTQKRVAKSRNAKSVTKSALEKRREEKSIKNKTTSSKKFVPPTIEEVRQYCTERGSTIDPERFLDTNTANGWKRGRHGNIPIQDWKAVLRTWEKNDKERNPPPASRIPATDEEWAQEFANGNNPKFKGGT